MQQTRTVRGAPIRSGFALLALFLSACSGGGDDGTGSPGAAGSTTVDADGTGSDVTTTEITEPRISRDPATTDTTAAVTDMVADVIIRASYAFGEVTVDQLRFDAAKGQTVGLVITSDTADQAHVHGYDLLGPIEAGGTGELLFTADTPGLFVVELESSGTFLFEILVR
jgi:hypothetical protein